MCLGSLFYDEVLVAGKNFGFVPVASMCDAVQHPIQLAYCSHSHESRQLQTQPATPRIWFWRATPRSGAVAPLLVSCPLLHSHRPLSAPKYLPLAAAAAAAAVEEMEEGHQNVGSQLLITWLWELWAEKQLGRFLPLLRNALDTEGDAKNGRYSRWTFCGRLKTKTSPILTFYFLRRGKTGYLLRARCFLL